MKNDILIFNTLIVLAFFSCEKKTETVASNKVEKPSVTELGRYIHFPKDPGVLRYFGYDTVKTRSLVAELNAPARVVASVVRNINQKTYNLILFSDPELTANFSVYLERLVNIKTYKLNLERVKDLQNNGAATGREVLEAQTLLHNEEAAIIENEAKFLLAGLEPEDLLNHKAGMVWLICDITENEVFKLKIGGTCKIRVKAYPNEFFYGKIEDFGDVVDNVTRMVKLRIEAENPSGKMKSGMFATVEFGTSEGRFLCVPGSAIITVQGKDYVFVRKSQFEFERMEVLSGQQIGEQIVIYRGVNENDIVITKGVMQLKGLSFGY